MFFFLLLLLHSASLSCINKLYHQYCFTAFFFFNQTEKYCVYFVLNEFRFLCFINNFTISDLVEVNSFLKNSLIFVHFDFDHTMSNITHLKRRNHHTQKKMRHSQQCKFTYI